MKVCALQIAFAQFDANAIRAIELRHGQHAVAKAGVFELGITETAAFYVARLDKTAINKLCITQIGVVEIALIKAAVFKSGVLQIVMRKVFLFESEIGLNHGFLSFPCSVGSRLTP
ncbi:hypothetical protein THZG08_160080 [Vibrio owensii]|nr:hypothetical protein THZG08_160080 [Vibrio owensii]CAH1553539.1 hypothetical protein THOA03_160080 [Vibrio owensii]